jgi:hypothetical protein
MKCTRMFVACHQNTGQRFMENVGVASHKCLGMIKTQNCIFEEIKSMLNWECY